MSMSSGDCATLGNLAKKIDSLVTTMNRVYPVGSGKPANEMMDTRQIDAIKYQTDAINKLTEQIKILTEKIEEQNEWFRRRWEDPTISRITTTTSDHQKRRG